MLVNSGVTVQSTNGSVWLQVGDNLTIDPAASISAFTLLRFTGDYDDADPGVGVIMNVNGNLHAGAAGALVETGADNDIINLYTVPAGVTTTVNAGDGADILNILRSTSEPGSATILNGQGGADTFNVEAVSDTIVANGDDGSDVFNVEISPASSGTLSLNGDAGDDLYNLFSNGATPAVYFSMDGGAGNDTSLFYPNWGQIDNLTDSGADRAIDTMDFSRIPDRLRFNIFPGQLTVTDGNLDVNQNVANSVIENGNTIEDLIGGQNNDSLTPRMVPNWTRVTRCGARPSSTAAAARPT